MSEPRRTFTREFKVAAVKQVTEKGRSFAEAARSIGITSELLRKGKSKLDAEGDDTFPGHGNLPPAEDELRRLKAEVACLKAERDILQKLRRSSPRSRCELRLHRRGREEWPVTTLCHALGVSTTGYYSWQKRDAGPQEHRRNRLLVEIEAIHAEMKARYGSRRIHAELVDRGHDCCVNTVAKVMCAAGIAAKTTWKFCHTTDSNHTLPVAENVLDRQFDATKPNTSWVADITSIPTRAGWLYLAVAEDLYSRMVVGWTMAAHIESRLVVDALEMAVARRLLQADLVAHSDRSRLYASEHYQRLLRQVGITCRMSRRANCWDNAPMESFFASLKKELTHHENYATRAQRSRASSSTS